MHDETFKTIAKALLRGTFVDQQAMRDEHAVLCDMAERADMDAWLGRIGLCTTTTSDGSAFFMTERDQGSDQKPTAKAMLEVRDAIWPVMTFLNLAHVAINEQDLLVPGAILRRSRLTTGIENDQTQQDTLRALTGKFPPMTSEGSVDKVVNKILKKMVDLGYLVTKNENEGIFVVTGRVQYMNDVIEFINEHGGVDQSDDGSEDEETEEVHEERLL